MRLRLLPAVFTGAFGVYLYHSFALMSSLDSVTTPASLLPKEETTTRSNARRRRGKEVAVTPTKTRPAKTNTTSTSSSDHILPRVLAIVFPQYHSDPLNDKLWGQGFTDWDSLRAAPLKNRLGLSIPRPTELGYYDLTDSEPRKRQGELAREYGVDGFVYHHYWFYDQSHPGPTLQAPLMKMLEDGHPDIPFCLHWCAAHWIDTWNARTLNTTKSNGGILQKQAFPDPTSSQVKEHYQWLRQFFHHPNYIKVNGQPVFMLYRKKPSSFPVLNEFRQLAIEDGFPGLYITIGMTFSHDDLFPPGIGQGQLRNRWPKDIINRTVAYPNPLEWLEKQAFKVPDWCQQERVPHHERSLQIAGILIAFDNTPRRGLDEAHLWSADEPDVVVERFYKSLRAAVYYETCCFPNQPQSTQDGRFILVNAMNEWAEGMAMEPSDVFGRRFLEAVRDAKADVYLSQCKWRAEEAA